MLYDQQVGQEAMMKHVNIAEAKAKLSELVKEAASGETIEITLRGKPVARLTASDQAAGRLDVDAIWARTRKMPKQSESAGDFIRKMHDTDRY
jgi:prevent-host-death family protein